MIQSVSSPLQLKTKSPKLQFTQALIVPLSTLGMHSMNFALSRAGNFKFVQSELAQEMSMQPEISKAYSSDLRWRMVIY